MSDEDYEFDDSSDEEEEGSFVDCAKYDPAYDFKFKYRLNGMTTDACASRYLTFAQLYQHFQEHTGRPVAINYIDENLSQYPKSDRVFNVLGSRFVINVDILPERKHSVSDITESSRITSQDRIRRLEEEIRDRRIMERLHEEELEASLNMSEEERQRQIEAMQRFHH